MPVNELLRVFFASSSLARKNSIVVTRGSRWLRDTRRRLFRPAGERLARGLRLPRGLWSTAHWRALLAGLESGRIRPSVLTQRGVRLLCAQEKIISFGTRLSAGGLRTQVGCENG